MQSIKQINEYFNQNFDQLKKYATRIIQDKRRDYEAGDVLSELYLTLQARREQIEKLDSFAKRFISNQIVFERSNMNLNQSGKSNENQLPEATTEEKEINLKDIKRELTRRERAFLLLWETEGSAKKAISKCGIQEKRGYEIVREIRRKSNNLKSK